ncbi:hypothetical protein ACIRVK_32180 [Streptomyces sp. NPDC101152]|uniref:hypothetical protein n=1 Tax=Streptomyces sp. NPDC101152 TaxID=3366116 RepID=UPI00382B198B
MAQNSVTEPRQSSQTATPATQNLTVDGGPARTITYPTTLNWTYRSTVRTAVSLTAGTHTLTLAKGATGEVTLDKSTSPRPPARTPSTRDLRRHHRIPVVRLLRLRHQRRRRPGARFR